MTGEPDPTTHAQDQAAHCTVRLFRQGDEDAAAELLTSAFPQWPKIDTDASAGEHLRWKLGEPLTAAAVLGEIDEKVVGLSIRSFRMTKVGGEEIVLQHGFDSCVHPDYRSTGLMSMIRASYRELLSSRGDLLIFFSSHSAFSHIRRTEGAVPFGTNIQVLTCNDPAPASPESGERDWTIESPTRFDGRADKLWAEASQQFDIAVARQLDFLNWRYCDRRGGTFVVRTAEEGGWLAGYAVLRVSGRVGYIADVLALPGRLDIVQSLVHNALGYFATLGVPSIEAWCSAKHPYAQLLASLGFDNKRRTLRLDWVAFTDLPDRELLSSRRLILHYMPGDSDLV